MATIKVELPENLAREVERRIRAGAFQDPRALVITALEYYLERHREEGWGQYVDEEIAWSRRHAGT